MSRHTDLGLERSGVSSIRACKSVSNLSESESDVFASPFRKMMNKAVILHVISLQLLTRLPALLPPKLAVRASEMAADDVTRSQPAQGTDRWRMGWRMDFLIHQSQHKLPHQGYCPTNCMRQTSRDNMASALHALRPLSPPNMRHSSIPTVHLRRSSLEMRYQHSVLTAVSCISVQ